MKRNKVEEVQQYLAARDIIVSEIAIVNAAIDIARRLGAGDYTFALEFEVEEVKEKELC